MTASTVTSMADRVVWITGAGSGIGRAAAVAFAREGARLALTGRRPEALEETALAVVAAGGAVSIVPADVGEAAAVDAAAAHIQSTMGRCDVLINSAGINVRDRSWATVGPAEFDQVLAIDLAGCFYTSRAVLPGMRAQKDGLIIQISSWSGRYVSPPSGPAYTAAKHALNALSESLNQSEFVNGVRSCCICPGEVATPILDNRPVPVDEVERRRMLQSEDVAATIMFVASLPASVCINEIVMSPTWNRLYAAQLAYLTGRA